MKYLIDFMPHGFEFCTNSVEFTHVTYERKRHYQNLLTGTYARAPHHAQYRNPEPHGAANINSLISIAQVSFTI